MRRSWVFRLLVVLTAMAAAFAAYSATIVLHHLAWLDRIPALSDLPVQARLIFGVPTFGGAPIAVHLLNHAWWGIPGALVYALILRLGFGHPVRWKRLILLYVTAVLMAAIFAHIMIGRGMAPLDVLANAQRIWFFCGLFIIRDWIVRPVHKASAPRAGAIA